MEGSQIDTATWIATLAAALATAGTVGTGFYLSRANRALLKAQAAKAGAEGEGTSVDAAVSLIREMREERKELQRRLEDARKAEAVTREEQERNWRERQDLKREIEVRDTHIRYLRKILRDAGVDAPAEMPEA
jgi:hypothetical protein